MGRTYRHKGTKPATTHPLDAGLPFAVTLHAAEQFRDRVLGPLWTVERSTWELRALARTAHRTDDRTGHGEEIWVATDGAPVRFVVRVDRGERLCVTVLEPERGAA